MMQYFVHIYIFPLFSYSIILVLYLSIFSPTPPPQPGPLFPNPSLRRGFWAMLGVLLPICPSCVSATFFPRFCLLLRSYSSLPTAFLALCLWPHLCFSEGGDQVWAGPGAQTISVVLSIWEVLLPFFFFIARRQGFWLAIVVGAWVCDSALRQRCACWLLFTFPRSSAPNTQNAVWWDQTPSSFSGHLIIHSFNYHGAHLICQAPY